MCQIAIDKVDADDLQQATRLTAWVSGKCDHGGEVYMRVLWNNGQIGPESTFKQVYREFHHFPLTWTAYNHNDRIQGIRVVVRCKGNSSYQETEV